MTAPIRIAVVYPDLLGTYGDGGNGLILARRAQWRGYQAELLAAPSDAPLPPADIYCLGGGEDGPQVRAARCLIDDGTLSRRAGEGAVVLAVCAGYQVVGRSFPGADGALHDGVGLLGITTTKGSGPRMVGEVVSSSVDAAAGLEEFGELGELGELTGFENHGGVTALDDGTQPLGRVSCGIGNGDGSGTEGAVAGRIVGTYLHGPVLARNPALADGLLGWALGVNPADLLPLEDDAELSLHAERLTGPARRRRLLRRRRVVR